MILGWSWIQILIVQKNSREMIGWNAIARDFEHIYPNQVRRPSPQILPSWQRIITAWAAAAAIANQLDIPPRCHLNALTLHLFMRSLNFAQRLIFPLVSRVFSTHAVELDFAMAAQLLKTPRRFAPLKEADKTTEEAPTLKGVIFDVDGTLW